MLKMIKNILFSTKLTAFLLFVFAIAIGTATFIENDYGTTASKALVFNAKWFELVLILLTINLIGNIFKYKLFRWETAATLTFHVAFIIILIGAGITRYISFEGAMLIREGEMSNTIISSDNYLQFKVDNQKMQYTFDKKLYLNPLHNSKFSYDLNFEGNEISVAYKDFIPNAIDTITTAEDGVNIIEIVTVGQMGRISRYIESGQTTFFGNFPVSFNNNTIPEAIKINETDSGLTILSPYEINYMSMDDISTSVIKKDTIQPFKNRRLYTIANVQLVFKQVYKKARIQQIAAPKSNPNGQDLLFVDVTCNNSSKEVAMTRMQNNFSNFTSFQLDNLNFSINYGSKKFTTPFYVQLNDFKLEKYPGSMSPSSYESDVTVIDERDSGKKFDHRIYMNNVLDYDGYRFFQSSYDQDEHGTILSVNHDFWGTSITYLGYLLMAIGMAISLMMKKSRFTTLRQNIKKLRAKAGIILGVIILSTSLFSSKIYAQGHKQVATDKNEFIINKEHAAKFSRLLVQDRGGRVKPIQTLASEILRKVARKENFNGQEPTQVFLGMMFNPGYWQSAPLIKVSNPKLEKKLGAKDHYVSFMNFFDENFNYIIAKEVMAATRKKPSEQNKYDKELIKVDERLNICYMVFQGEFLRIFPKNNDKNNTWFTAADYHQFVSEDSIFVKNILGMYYNSI